MEITILPYNQLPEFIREDELLRQILLKSGGIMKYVAEHIDDPIDNDTPPLFAQYQNHVAEDYRRLCRWNPNRQNWSIEDLRQRALNGRNHLGPELKSRRVLMQKLNMHKNKLFKAIGVVDNFNLKYLEYAWKEDLRRRYPDIETDLGTYKYVMNQFYQFDKTMFYGTRGRMGLACRSINIALKTHHGYELTEQDIYDSFEIEMFHLYFFGPTIIDRLERGLAELLKGTELKECRAEVINMLKNVKWFSQHIYHDEVEDVYDDSFTVEDKRWLRSVLEHYDKDGFSQDEFNFFYFGKLFADIGFIWKKLIFRNHDLDLSKLEKKIKSFIYTSPSERELTWEDEKWCFKMAVSRVMERKDKDGSYLFKDPTQWKAVYRFAVDKGIMYDLDDQNGDNDPEPYTSFSKFANELQFDNSSIRIPFRKAYIEEMKKENYARYNKSYPWLKKGITHASTLELYDKLNNVYKALYKEYRNLIQLLEKNKS